MLATAIPLSHAQRALLAEVAGAEEHELAAHAARLVERVAVLVRCRALRDRDSADLLARLEGLAAALRTAPGTAHVRAAVWSAVEGVTRRPWGIGATGAIDRLVVAGAIADALASDAAAADAW